MTIDERVAALETANAALTTRVAALETNLSAMYANVLNLNIAANKGNDIRHTFAAFIAAMSAA